MSISYTLLPSSGDYLGNYVLGKLDEQLDEVEFLSSTGTALGTGSARLRVREDGEIELRSLIRPRIEANCVFVDKELYGTDELPQIVGRLTDRTFLRAAVLPEQVHPREKSTAIQGIVFLLDIWETPSFHSVLENATSAVAYLPPDLNLFDFRPQVTALGAYEVLSDGAKNGKSPLQQGSLHNRLEFEVDGFYYGLHQASDVTEIVVEAESASTELTSQIYRFAAGLSFLLGRNLRRPGYYLESSDGRKYVISPEGGARTGTLPTPLPDFRELYRAGMYETEAKCWARALECWLSKGKREVDVFAYISVLLGASSAPFDVKAQLLCSSIEGICRAHHEHDPSGAEQIRDSVKVVKKFLKTWKRRKTESVSPAVGERIASLLAILDHASAPDAIRGACNKLGFSVTKHELEAFRTLRTPTAHGMGIEVLDLCAIRNYETVMRLFYRLCLRSVGYAGPMKGADDNVILI